MVIPKFNKEEMLGYWNARNSREKILFAGFIALVILILDFWFLIRPVSNSFSSSDKSLSLLKSEYKTLVSDNQNKDKIASMWQETKDRLGEAEKKFIGPNEIPALLENLSGLAKNSSIKLLSLAPSESSKSPESSYGRVVIRMSAVAGTHELGKFLSHLETSATFFRVANIKISENSLDLRHHLIDLSVEVYRK